jgi:hypothetical protein
MTIEEEYREYLAPHVLGNPLYQPLILSSLPSCHQLYVASVVLIFRQPHGIFAEPMEANTGTTKATSGQAPLIVSYTMSLMLYLA